jgi:hypothetical protein
MRVQTKIILLVAFLVLPFVLSWLSQIEQNSSLIWLLAHQLHYSPISWIGPPFFQPDSDMGFSVTPLGRGLTCFVYALGITGSTQIFSEFIRRRRAD